MLIRHTGRRRVQGGAVSIAAGPSGAAQTCVWVCGPERCPGPRCRLHATRALRRHTPVALWDRLADGLWVVLHVRSRPWVVSGGVEATYHAPKRNGDRFGFLVVCRFFDNL